MSTPYHSQYFAWELTRKCSSSERDKLNASILSASVKLNPHQIDAALFAFRSQLSRGALLADGVGMGKTIEAGLIMSQLWAEHKSRILGITPRVHSTAVDDGACGEIFMSIRLSSRGQTSAGRRYQEVGASRQL